MGYGRLSNFGIFAIVPLLGFLFWMSAALASGLVSTIVVGVDVHALNLPGYTGSPSQRPAPLSLTVVNDARHDAGIDSPTTTEAAPTPAASPRASSAPAATPTSSPLPVATPSSSPLPVATPSSSPLPVATPSASPLPVATPSASPLPLPTVTLAPLPVPTPNLPPVPLPTL